MILNFINHSIPLLFFAGMSGAFISDVLQDNSIILPTRVSNIFNLGFIGSILIGGVAGCVIDGSFLTAFMGGYMGKSIIKNLVKRNI